MKTDPAQTSQDDSKVIPQVPIEVVGDGFPMEKDVSTPPKGTDQADDEEEE